MRPVDVAIFAATFSRCLATLSDLEDAVKTALTSVAKFRGVGITALTNAERAELVEICEAK